jgi:hypothetical protein
MRKASSTAQQQRSPGKSMGMGCDGDFDADHDFGLDGVGRSAH